MGVFSALLATTTTSRTFTSAPGARGGCTQRPRVPWTSKHASRAQRARGPRRAVQPAGSVPQIRIHLLARRARQIAPAMLGQKVLTEKRVCYVWRGSIRQTMALSRAQTVEQGSTLTRWALIRTAHARPVRIILALWVEVVSRPAACATLGSREQTATRARYVRRGSTRTVLALPRAPTAAQGSTLPRWALIRTARARPVRTILAL